MGIIEGTGLVLAGGGGKGIYQVGILKSLAEAGLLDDVVAVSGTSIGSVNGALFVEGLAEGGMKHAIEQMEQTWDEIDYNVFFNVDPSTLEVGDKRFSRNATRDLINKYLSYELFSSDVSSEQNESSEDNSQTNNNLSDKDNTSIKNNNNKILPMYCTVARCPARVTTSETVTAEEMKLLYTISIEETYADYQEEYLCLSNKSKEEITDIILATTALPVIYSPVMMNGSLYVDGGVRDNVPIKPLYDLGIRKFIVIELSTESSIKNIDSYADAEIIDIKPSYDLGALITGTMNFDAQDKSFKKTLGELDGKRYIKTLFEKDETYIAVEPALAKMDYERAQKKGEFDKKYDNLNENISSRFSYIDDIEKKYGKWDSVD